MLICILFSIAYATITKHNLKDLYSKYVNIDFQVESGVATKLLQENNNGMFYQLLYQKGFDETKITENNKLIIWLQGGPGCSSQKGIYNQIGPFQIVKSENDFTIQLKSNSWNEFASVLFIDQPFGAGYSYGDTIIKSTQQASSYFVEFLGEFFKIHSEFAKAPTFLAGADYAGHFIPYFSQQLLEKNILQNYKGIIIGNAFFSVLQQISSTSNYLQINGLLDQEKKQFENKFEAQIQQSILQHQSFEAGIKLERYYNELITVTKSSLNDISLKSELVQNQDWLDFMNKNKDQFGIQTAIQNVCDDNISISMISDYSFDVSQNMLFLLSKGTILVYNGQMDVKINAAGIYNWIISLRSENIQKWKNQQKKFFKINDQTVGNFQKSDTFTLATLYNIGHDSIEEKPEVIYEMIKHHINNDEDWY